MIFQRGRVQPPTRCDSKGLLGSRGIIHGGVHGISIEWEFITSDEDRIYRTRVTVQGGWLTPHGNKHTHTHPTVLTLNQGIFQELQKEVLSYIALG